ncbi:unnamed protein product [Victoria cruziana]
MDLKLMQRFLPYAAIAIVTAFSLWSRRSSRCRGKSERSNDSEDGDRAEVSSLPSSSPSSGREVGFEYDVFISFRGSDTRKNFTDLLHEALTDKGVKTFIDNENLEKGKKVEELLHCIQKSKIFVPIFSRNYADSEWCLKEITKMVECDGLIVPVFIDVEPRDVRHQTGPFVSAFRRHRRNKKIDEEEVSKWSEALTKAGGISGYTLDATHGYQGKFIQVITKRILGEINKTPRLIVAEHPVGLESRIADVKEMLDVEVRDDVRIVGIHGMGGIGKTTLSKAVYNEVSSRFDACSFLSNVREAAKQTSGLVPLQKQLFGDVFNDATVHISNTHDGIAKIKERIGSKKVLLVLDDVDHKSQLDELVGDLDWFHRGSRIIVTTRDKQLLGAPRVKQNHVYEVKELDDTQALELFCRHAFGKKEPNTKFADLSIEVASTAAGLPLVLKLFGSHFFDLKTVEQWRKMLRRLKKDQHKDIHERLRISFDVLDEIEKKVFLDIACFLIGQGRQQREHATVMWEDCEFFPDITIQVLMHKSLVSINNDTGEFEMHDHIRDMGRKIAQSNEAGKCTRLWNYDEAVDVLRNKRGRADVEAIRLICEEEDGVCMDTESLVGMPRLRMLQLQNVTLKGECEDFPRNLRWLKWSSRDSDSLPSCLHLEDKVFHQLKVLDLWFCTSLVVCPDFTRMPHLEILIFDVCRNMRELHPSIGHLKSLIRLNLRYCNSLKELPEEIYELTSLQELDLSYCGITALPWQSGDSKSSSEQHVLGKLQVLLLSECRSLTRCPDFMKMPSLERLSFNKCKGMNEIDPSIGHLKSLIRLDLNRCRSLKELPQEIGRLTSLKELILSSCYQIPSLPESIVSLVQLETLNIYYCKLLKSLPQLPPSLIRLDARWCFELESVGDISNVRGLQELALSGCERLLDVAGIEHLKFLEYLKLERCASLFESIVGRIKDLDKLKRLHVCSCESLTKSPHFTSNLTDLQELDFSYCVKMTEVDPSIQRLKALTRLNLSNCKLLKELPESICLLLHLEELNVSECKSLASLPNSLGDLNNLRRLLLSGTAVKELPDSIFSLKQLSFLSVDLCRDLKFLPQLPPSLVTLSAEFCTEMVQINGVSFSEGLQELKLTGCGKLVDIPSIKQSTGLRELMLEGCRSLGDSFLEGFEVLDELQRLRLRNCESLTKSPRFTCNKTQWRELDLGGCVKMIEVDPSIRHLKALTRLTLCKCESLKELPEEVYQLSSLEYLDLRSCSSLREVPDTICLLFHLQVIDASGCKSLASLPNSLGNLKSLRYLYLRGTAIEFLPRLPPSVTWIDASDCRNLRGILGIEQLKGLAVLDLGGCVRLEDSLLERLESVFLNNEGLIRFSIPGRLIEGGSSCPQSLSFPVPKHLKDTVLYLYVDESSFNSIKTEIEHRFEQGDESMGSGDEVGGCMVRLAFSINDVQFLFSTSFYYHKGIPTASFRYEEVMKKVAEADVDRVGMMKMQASIDGCTLLHGDFFSFDPDKMDGFDRGQNVVRVEFH